MKSTVYLLCGLPLSGKTFHSKKLENQLNITLLSIDEEYFKVVGNTQQEYRDYKLEQDIEEKLKIKIIELLKSNKSIILDYGFWKKKKRDEYKKIIEDNGGEWRLIYFKTSKDELLQRLNKRNTLKHDNYQYMTSIMLEDFYNKFEEPIDEDEEII